MRIESEFCLMGSKEQMLQKLAKSFPIYYLKYVCFHLNHLSTKSEWWQRPLPQETNQLDKKKREREKESKHVQHLEGSQSGYKVM